MDRIQVSNEASAPITAPPRAQHGHSSGHLSDHPSGHRDIFSNLRPLRSRATPSLTTATRAEIRAYFENTWDLTEVLFSSLQSEDAFLYPPVHGLRHPMMFYYGHTAVFYVNKLREAGWLEKPLNEYFESHFDMGVDENSWDDLSKNEKPWPSLAELKDYRHQIHELVARMIETEPSFAPGHAPITPSDPAWALFMAIEHERIHLETSAVLIRELSQDFVTTPERFPKMHPSAERPSTFPPVPGFDFPLNPWIEAEAGHVQLGKSENWPVFAWDNEFGKRTTEVAAFAATRQLISNGEFLDFVIGGGYGEARFWSEDGWAWREFRKALHPAFWISSGQNRFYLRTTFETIEMPWNWPVVVNYHEAKAFAAWRSEQDGSACRLLSEAEHHRLRQLNDPSYPPARYEDWYGDEENAGSPLYENANFELRWGSESPVDLNPSAKTQDVFGNVWQWCEDAFNPLEGFDPHPYYPDYSAPSFDGKHQMIMGGSFISTGSEATPWVRSHFRPHFFQNAGFRLVRGNFA